MFFSEIRVGADYMEVERSLNAELFFVGFTCKHISAKLANAFHFPGAYSS